MKAIDNSFVHKQAGMSHVEVLVAIFLIAVVLVPAMEALQPALQGSEVHKQEVEIQFALQDKIEDVLSLPFSDLDNAATVAGSYTTATVFSDASGVEYQRNVFLWRYDLDNADADNNVYTGGEDNILWLRVALADGSHAYETLINQ